jgi:HEAT repeat protein
MKRITLTVVFVAAVATAAAQEPPTPPPARPARPADVTPPRPAPRPTYVRPPVTISPFDIDELRLQAAEIARASRDFEFEANREAIEAVRIHSAEIADAAREATRVMLDDRLLAPIAPLPAIDIVMPDLPTPAIAPMAFGRASDGFAVARPQWVQGDPADSVYRLAHEILGRGDYGRAAQMFREIAQKYPKSSYQDDLPYFEAFARYRIGTTDELRTAAKLLEPRASKLIGTTSASNQSVRTFYTSRRGASEGDVVGLYVRVNSALAQRGDRGAADIVAKAAQAGANTCDREDMQVRAEAMSALSQMDPAAALPILRRVLDKKDECTVELRRRAVFMLGRRADGEAASLLATTAKSDPSASVRSEAIGWLPKLQGDAGVNMLEEILRTEQDERIQRSVIRALVSSDNQRARSSMRALIDRKDAPINLRVEAISSFNNERATTEDAAYLRSLYSRADNDRVKDAIINAVARIGGQENEQWVLNLAKSPNEPSQLRATAIARLVRSNVSIADLSKLYDAADSYDVRSRIVGVLENRKEPEAADKLVDIIRNSTVQNIRAQALNALTRRKDPRSVQLLQDIIDGKRP